MSNRLLTLQEVAQLLRVDQATIYRMARSGKIPASKVGRQWRFEVSLVTQWLHHNSNSNSNSNRKNSF